MLSLPLPLSLFPPLYPSLSYQAPNWRSGPSHDSKLHMKEKRGANSVWKKERVCVRERKSERESNFPGEKKFFYHAMRIHCMSFEHNKFPLSLSLSSIFVFLLFFSFSRLFFFSFSFRFGRCISDSKIFKNAKSENLNQPHIRLFMHEFSAVWSVPCLL